MRVIDGSKMMELLESAVAERGDAWVYPDVNACRYWYDPSEGSDRLHEVFGNEAQPACAVGLAFANFDNSLIEFINENEYNSMGVSYLIDQMSANSSLDVKFTDKASLVAEAMQEAQDNGASWGDALIRAKDVLTDPKSRDTIVGE